MTILENKTEPARNPGRYRTRLHLLLILLSTSILGISYPEVVEGATSDTYLPSILKINSSSDETLSPLRSPTIGSVTTNLSDYPGGQVPRYDKLELTFTVDTPLAMVAGKMP